MEDRELPDNRFGREEITYLRRARTTMYKYTRTCVQVRNACSVQCTGDRAIIEVNTLRLKVKRHFKKRDPWRTIGPRWFSDICPRAVQMPPREINKRTSFSVSLLLSFSRYLSLLWTVRVRSFHESSDCR